MPHDRSQIGGWWKNAISLVVVERLAGVWGDKLAEFLEVVAFACRIQFRWVSFFKMQSGQTRNDLTARGRQCNGPIEPSPWFGCSSPFTGSGEDETCHQPRGGAKVLGDAKGCRGWDANGSMYFKNTTLVTKVHTIVTRNIPETTQT